MDARVLLLERIRDVDQRVRDACARAGRASGNVAVVAVTKTVPVEIARLALDLGHSTLGENRPQELWRKAEQIDRLVDWHLIGHLQRNKIAKTLPLVKLIHSVDSVRLLLALDEEAGKQLRVVDILLEANVSGEATKQGFSPADIEKLGDDIGKLRNVRVRGLMTMAAYEDDPQKTRPTFSRLRELRDALRSEVDAQHPLDHLSMGMSHDFEIAIEEGATLVRLGSVLFAGLEGGGS